MDNTQPPSRKRARTRQDIVVSGHAAAAAAACSNSGSTTNGVTNAVLQQDPACVKTLNAHLNWVSLVSDIGKNQIISGSYDTSIKLWDLTSGSCIRTFTGHTATVFCIAPVGAGMSGHSDTTDTKHTTTKFISGSVDNHIKLWDLQTGQCLRTFRGHFDSVESVAAIDEDKFISGSSDNTIKLWNWVTGECLHTFKGSSGAVWAVAKVGSHNGGGRCTIANSNGCTTHDTTNENDTSSRTNSNSNSNFISVHDKDIKLWNLSTKSVIQTYDGHAKDVWSIAVVDDGTQFISASSDATIKLWDIDSGECIRTFKGHCGSVESVAISGNDTIVSGSWDRTIKLWNIHTGECIHTYHGHSKHVSSVACAVRDEIFVSSSSDLTIKIWKIYSS